MRALVVDDDDSLRSVVRDLLIELGCHAVSFTTWAHSSRFARDRAPTPDLIVLDVESRKIPCARRRLATQFSRAAIVAVDDGEYEGTLETAFRTTRRRRVPARSTRTSKRATSTTTRRAADRGPAVTAHV